MKGPQAIGWFMLTVITASCARALAGMLDASHRDDTRSSMQGSGPAPAPLPESQAPLPAPSAPLPPSLLPGNHAAVLNGTHAGGGGHMGLPAPVYIAGEIFAGCPQRRKGDLGRGCLWPAGLCFLEGGGGRCGPSNA
jgi:hypothetical protein